MTIFHDSWRVLICVIRVFSQNHHMHAGQRGHLYVVASAHPLFCANLYFSPSLSWPSIFAPFPDSQPPLLSPIFAPLPLPQDQRRAHCRLNHPAHSSLSCRTYHAPTFASGSHEISQMTFVMYAQISRILKGHGGSLSVEECGFRVLIGVSHILPSNRRWIRCGVALFCRFLETSGT